MTVYNKTATGNRVVDNLQDSVGLLSKLPMLRGVEVTANLHSTGHNIVTHSLGRHHQGWFIVGRTTTGVVYEFDTPVDDPTRQMALKTTVTGTYRIWVY